MIPEPTAKKETRVGTGVISWQSINRSRVRFTRLSEAAFLDFSKSISTSDVFFFIAVVIPLVALYHEWKRMVDMALRRDNADA